MNWFLSWNKMKQDAWLTDDIPSKAPTSTPTCLMPQYLYSACYRYHVILINKCKSE